MENDSLICTRISDGIKGLFKAGILVSKGRLRGGRDIFVNKLERTDEGLEGPTSLGE